MNRFQKLLLAAGCAIAIGGCGDATDLDRPGLSYLPEAGTDISLPEAKLAVDANRNGVADFDEPGDLAHRYEPQPGYGALFLPNIDDDTEICDLFSEDADFENCHDAALDGIVNDVDLEDMGTIKTFPTGGVSDQTYGVLDVDDASRDAVELYVATGDGEGADRFEPYEPGEDRIGADQLSDGVEFAIEARYLAGDTGQWDGVVELTWEIAGELNMTTRDYAHMRVAPLLLRHHLDPAHTVYVSNLGSRNAAFRQDLEAAVDDTAIPGGLTELDRGDPWTRDFMLNGYVAIPGPDGPRKIEMYIRSANLNYPGSLKTVYERLYELIEPDFPPLLRRAGRAVYTDFHGVDSAGEAVYDPDKGFEPPEIDGVDVDDVVAYLYGGDSDHEYPEIEAHVDRVFDADTLDSFGNTDAIPPHVAPDGTEYPHGRVLRGRGEGDMRPDPTLSGVIEAQGEQPIVWLDTAWLAVAHVDETISFVETDTDRGWSVLYNDPSRARELLEEVRDDHQRGDAVVFEGKYYPRSHEDCSWEGDGWDCPEAASAERTVEQILDDTDIMAASARAAVEIDAQLETLTGEVGLSDDELHPIAFLHEEIGSGNVAYQPAIINGLSIRPDAFATSRPHGPRVDGEDVFVQDVESVLDPLDVQVHWLESWDIYHTGLGGVHCATNSSRELPETPWWLKRREVP